MVPLDVRDSCTLCPLATCSALKKWNVAIELQPNLEMTMQGEGNTFQTTHFTSLTHMPARCGKQAYLSLRRLSCVPGFELALERHFLRTARFFPTRTDFHTISQSKRAYLSADPVSIATKIISIDHRPFRVTPHPHPRGTNRLPPIPKSLTYP